jgi:N-acetyl-anhydromuramyl-L-alanine amidase AmpD
MPPNVDKTSYNKAAHYPQRHGYQSRGGGRPSSIVIHTTSNGRKTAFETEANYLFKSANVSAHFLISKTGAIVEFLDPLKFQAWHAGNTIPAYLNARSIGIEHHVSVGEGWTAVQEEACTWLVRHLMAAFDITPPLIETHRAVALPKGRKKDPAGWGDEAFYAWRATLAHTRRYRVRGLPVYEQSDRDGPLWGHLASGDVIEVDDHANGHVSALNGVPAGIGFIRFDPDTLEAML